MKLFNLIDVIDHRISIMITGETPSGNKIGYDFKNKDWMDNCSITPQRLIKAKDIRHTKFYSSFKGNSIKNFNSMRASSIKTLENIETHRNIIFNITINTGLDKRALRKEGYFIKNKSKTFKPKTCNKIDKISNELEEDFYQSQVLGIPLK